MLLFSSLLLQSVLFCKINTVRTKKKHNPHQYCSYKKIQPHQHCSYKKTQPTSTLFVQKNNPHQYCSYKKHNPHQHCSYKKHNPHQYCSYKKHNPHQHCSHGKFSIQHDMQHQTTKSEISLARHQMSSQHKRCNGNFKKAMHHKNVYLLATPNKIFFTSQMYGQFTPLGNYCT